MRKKIFNANFGIKYNNANNKRWQVIWCYTFFLFMIILHTALGQQKICMLKNAS